MSSLPSISFGFQNSSINSGGSGLLELKANNPPNGYQLQWDGGTGTWQSLVGWTLNTQNGAFEISLSPEFTTLYQARLLDVNGNVLQSKSQYLYVEYANPVVEISASATTINAGQPVTISAIVAGVSGSDVVQASIGNGIWSNMNGWSFTGGVYSRTFTPSQPTTYAVRVLKFGGSSVSQSVAVNVVNTQPGLSLAASPLSVRLGQETTLTATVTNMPAGSFLEWDQGVGNWVQVQNWTQNGNVYTLPLPLSFTETFSVRIALPNGTFLVRSATISVPPPIVTLSATFASITAGSTTTLEARFSNIPSGTVLQYSANGGPLISLDTWTLNNGLYSLVVNPSVTTTYAVRMTFPNASFVQGLTTINVTQPPQVLTLNASATTVAAGQPVTMTCVAKNFASGTTFAVSIDGGATFQPMSSWFQNGTIFTKTFNPQTSTSVIVEATPPVGPQVTRTVAITVPTPVVRIVANPNPIYASTPVNLTILVENLPVGSVVQFNNGSGWQALSGWVAVINGAETVYTMTVNAATQTTYQARVLIPGQDTISSSVTVSIAPPPPTVTLTASPMTLTPGGLTNLSATVANVPEGSVLVYSDGDGFWNTMSAWTQSGNTYTIQLAVETTANFTVKLMLASGASVQQTRTVTVSGTTPLNSTPRITEFFADPQTINAGDTTTLIWNCANLDTYEVPAGDFLWQADTASIQGGIPSIQDVAPDGGTLQVSPGVTKTFTLTVNNGGKQLMAKTTVIVNFPQITHDFADGNGPVPAQQWPNGGGWVANTASVDSSVYVSVDAVVFQGAELRGNVQLYGNSEAYGNCHISDSAVLNGGAKVLGDAQVSGNALVAGGAVIDNQAVLGGNVVMEGTVLVTGGTWTAGTYTSGTLS